MSMQNIGYKPRVNLGIVAKRNGINDAARYARRPRIAPTVPPPPVSVITAPIRATDIYQSGPKITRPPPLPMQAGGGTYTDPSHPFYSPPGSGPAFEVQQPFDTAIPETFGYSREQLRDMLIRGATETFDRSGEDEEGLPIATDLEQKSREIDATKQYGVDASAGVLPGEAAPGDNKAVGWLFAAVVGYFLLGG